MQNEGLIYYTPEFLETAKKNWFMSPQTWAKIFAANPDTYEELEPSGD